MEGFSVGRPNTADRRKIPVSQGVSNHLIRLGREGGVKAPGAVAMNAHPESPHVFGPYDGDFDPFDDDEDAVVLVTFV